MTLSSMLLELYRDLGYDATPAATITTRLTSYINEVHRRVLSMPGMERLRSDNITVASVADREYVALPQSVAHIRSIVDRTDGRTLPELELRRVRERNPMQTTGKPEAFAILGERGVAVQPSDASAIFVDSTSASDTGTAFIEGVVSGGYLEESSVTMTGTTGVQIGSLSTWVQIDQFYLSAAAVGTVTLHEDAEGGTELSRISIGNTSSRYLHIVLDPVPSAAVTYNIDYIRHIDDLANANDEPFLPRDFHWILTSGARAKEYERRQDLAPMQIARAEQEEGLSALKHWVISSGVMRQKRRRLGFSQLGSEFPAGS